MANNSLPQGPDAALLAEIENLQLVARQAAHGAMAGMHRATRRGQSIEFSEHKVYSPGDDIRHIDWRAFAKTDRFHIKQFEDETSLRLELLVDHSGSMGFGADGNQTKLAFAKTLAAAMSYIALRQGDATGLLTFAEAVTDELPPRSSSGHLVEILARLAKLHVAGSTGILGSLDHFAQSRRRRTVTVILSDLFDPDPAVMDAFRRLAARRHDVTVMHLLDPVEVNFPYDNPATFASMEDERRLFVHPRVLRSAFVEEMRRFVESTSRQLSEVGIEYRQITTDQSPARVLGEWLRRREARRS